MAIKRDGDDELQQVNANLPQSCILAPRASFVSSSWSFAEALLRMLLF
jgi:hypothetical protein